MPLRIWVHPLTQSDGTEKGDSVPSFAAGGIATPLMLPCGNWVAMGYWVLAYSNLQIGKNGESNSRAAANYNNG